MADRNDLEFTYSLIDRVFRLSMGELADFSGAMYDGDFSLTLEEAQTRKHDYIVERLEIGPGRRMLDLGCGWGPLLDVVRRAGREGVGVTLSSAQVAACRRQRSRRPPVRRAGRSHSRDLRSLRCRRQPRRLRALLFSRGVPGRTPGVGLPHSSPASRRAPRHRPLLPADDGVRAEHDPGRRGRHRRRRESDAWYLALMGHQFPGRGPRWAWSRSRRSRCARVRRSSSTGLRRMRLAARSSAPRAAREQSPRAAAGRVQNHRDSRIEDRERRGGLDRGDSANSGDRNPRR